jgi:hypothetical protein
MSAPSYMPVEAKPWRLRMGLRPLEVQRWLEVDSNRSEELAIKHRLLDSPDTHSQVVGHLPGSQVEGKELLGLVLEHLSRHHPGLVTATPDGRLHEGSTGHVVDPEHLHPVDVAARLVQEDLCLMTRAGRRWVLGSASVCFPSRWSLPDKVGRDLSAIHAPVPGYEEELARPAQSFFDRLTPDRPMWRLNWTLLTDPSLHQPDPGSRRTRRGGAIDPGRDIWFRVERQTLRRLQCEAVVFTIRTYVTPLPELLERQPEARAALTVALSGAGPEVLAYKGWEDLAPRLVAWLAG